jgi:hypothetical protein
MRVQGRIGLATAFVLVIPSFVQAQRATGIFHAAPGGSAPVQASVSVGRATVSSGGAASAGASAPVRVHTGSRVASPHPVRSGVAGSSAGHSFTANHFGNFDAGFDGLSVQQILNPVPGFGFDYEHLAAIHRDDNIKAFIDPATQARLAVAKRRLRREHFGGGGFVLLDGGGAYAIPADDVNGDANGEQGPAGDDAQQGQGQQQGQEQLQPIFIIQQAAAAPQSGESQGALDAQNGMQQPEEEPLRDVGEFTLVLMSGREIETVAFTRASDKIVYITAEGGRRTLAMDELDIDATVRLNQERGTPLQLPL